MPTRKFQDFSAYRQFTDDLRALAVTPRVDAEWTNKVSASLDGVAGAELRRLVELPTRRAFGAFFTGSVLAEQLLGDLRFRTGKQFIYDPTVGAGDLLLAAARRLPLRRTLANTLAEWGQCLAGTDLQTEFVEATKLRIALLARQRHGGKTMLPSGWQSLLPHIRCANGLEQKSLFARATHLLMNPPYSLTTAPTDCKWAGGRVSEAALFVVSALEQVTAKTRLLAILPDVLCSGSFQHHWRERVSDLGEIASVERYGIFDDSADVDVFLLDVQRRSTIGATANRWPTPGESNGASIADYFDVHVERVVPHRDPEAGKLHPYIHPRNVPVWEEMTRFPDKRRHVGLPLEMVPEKLKPAVAPGALLIAQVNIEATRAEDLYFDKFELPDADVLKKPKPFLVILDVGHGSAAVLHDEGGTVVFDTGKGAHVGRHLWATGVKRIEAILLSHADADHIGGAVTLLMNTTLEIDEVLLNSDASKNSAVFEHLCYALAEANQRAGTRFDRRLATSTRIERNGSTIEVLHPPDTLALSGVGGKSKSGKRHTSNSLSAAIRISCGPKSSVLLGGDIAFDCLDGWKTRGVSPSACVLVFPHHGGLPGTVSESDAALCAFELMQLVVPSTVLFSNHRTKHKNPRDEVVSAICKANSAIRCACTQLPDRFHTLAQTTECWALHRSSRGIVEGSIRLGFTAKGVSVSFCSSLS